MIQSPDSTPTPTTASHSRYLTKEVVRCYNAISFANRVYGLPMNTHIILALGTIGIQNHDRISEIVSQFNHRVGKWLAGRDCPHVYVYSHEGYSKRGFGMHSHVLTHVPREAISDFRCWAIECVSKLTGLRVTERTVFVREGRSRQEHHQVRLQWIWFRYLNKGCDPAMQVRNGKTRQRERVCEVLRLRGSNEGVVHCRRRAGMSENIAVKAQKTAGFRSAFDECDDENLFSGWEFHAYRRELEEREYAARLAEIDDALGFSLMRL